MSPAEGARSLPGVDHDGHTIDVGPVVVGPYKENRWPFQWIAYCTRPKPECGVGIRCNDRRSAERFMRDNCSHYSDERDEREAGQ